MASRVTLPFWPTSLNCLSWSSDNIIAVAGGDQIGILSPRLQGPGPNGTHWNSITFRANAFTTDEAPLLHPLAFANFSPGEELSLRHVQALAWSPPGLGRFRHCVLAVLNTNHVLSIWECDGRADISANWKRTVVINHALISHYANLEKAIGATEQQFSERKQVSQRVRAFAWSPTLNWPGDEQVTSTQLLAVLTEAGDIIFLRIRAPYDLLAAGSTNWQVEVMHSVHVSEVVAAAHSEVSKEPSKDKFFAVNHTIADHIAWGLWQTVGDAESAATVVFIANKKLYTLVVRSEAHRTLSGSGPLQHTQINHLIPSRSDLTGPLMFIPGSNMLTVFAADAVYCVDSTISTENGTHLTSHHLDARWDEVSGVASAYDSTGLVKLHIVSHLSSSNAVTTVVSAPLNSSEASDPPKWQTAIVQAKSTFSTQHSLDGHVQERTWGVASSPLGDSVATAITLLPSDSVAHIIPSDRQAIIGVTREVPFKIDHILPRDARTHSLSSDVILSRLQRYLEWRSEAIELDDLVQMLLLSRNTERVGGDGNTGPSISKDSEPYNVVRQLRSQVLDQPDVTRERYITLARIALGLDSSSGGRLAPQIIQRLTSEVAKLDSHLGGGGELSRRIRQIYNTVSSKLAQTPHHAEDASSETCDICSSPIRFESIKWARCDSGHRFSRCALTFLAIQEPGFSKHCRVCGVQQLNEWKLPALSISAGSTDVEATDVVMQDGSDHDEGAHEADQATSESWVHVSNGRTSSSESSRSLARVLFAAFDTCIYCGGKFVS